MDGQDERKRNGARRFPGAALKDFSSLNSGAEHLGTSRIPPDVLKLERARA